MVDSFVEVLLRRLPPSEIAGIYLKGSAQKEWESPVDYVPELSDVDLHLLFHDPADIARRLGDTAAALEIHADLEQAYRARVPDPLHLPRPQLVLLNRLLQDPEYCPSPPGAVQALYGQPHDEPPKPPEEIREVDRRALGALLLLAQAERLKALPLRALDRPGPYLLPLLRDLNWQMSPTGPRLLALLGVPWEEAWSLNRTRIISRLESLGRGEFTADYAAYYLSGWDYFLSGYTDSDPARAAVAAFARATARAADIAGPPGPS